MFLAEILKCSSVDALATLLEHLQSLDEDSAMVQSQRLQQILLKWAAHYLYNEKHRRRPLDHVAWFHIGNGAIMDQLHWGADLSPKGWRNSFGLMVTYRYDLGRLAENQSGFEKDSTIAAGDLFREHLGT